MRKLLKVLALIVEAGDVLEFKKPAKKKSQSPSPGKSPSGKGITFEDQKANRERLRQEQNEKIRDQLKRGGSGGSGGGGGGGGHSAEPQRGSAYKDEEFEPRSNSTAVDTVVIEALDDAWGDLDSDLGGDLLHHKTETDSDGYYRVKGMPYTHSIGSGYIPSVIEDEIRAEEKSAYDSAIDDTWDKYQDELEAANISKKDVDYHTLEDHDSDIANEFDEFRDAWLDDEEWFISMGVGIEDEDGEVVVWADVSADQNYAEDYSMATFTETVKIIKNEKGDIATGRLRTHLKKALKKAVKFAS